MDESSLVDTDLAELNPPKTVSLTLNNGILGVVGSASHQWITETRDKVKRNPRIKHLNENEFVDLDEKKLRLLMTLLEKETILFTVGTANIRSFEITDCQQPVVTLTQQILDFAKITGKTPHIDLIGHTDQFILLGGDTVLERLRAEQVRDYLLTCGLPPVNFRVIGTDNNQPPNENIEKKGREWQRSVTFKVDLQ